MLSNILKGAAGTLSTYSLGNSYDFGAVNTSKYFSRTFGTGGNEDKWTLSMWIKLASVTDSGNKMLFTSNLDGDDYAYIMINSVEYFVYFTGRNGGTDEYVYTNANQFAANTWYHVVVAYDPTQTVNAAKCSMYINNAFKTFTVSSAPTLTYGYFNKNILHALGVRARPGLAQDSYFEGKIADVHFIDGQFLSPSNFGETVSSVWKPKEYTGTYGTTGFRLNFSDTTSATTLGYDVSGNGNNWTPGSAISTSDVSTDVP